MKSSTHWQHLGLIMTLTLVNSFTYANEVIEEVVVQARLLSGAEALVNERMDDDVVTDIIGSEFISRVGDSTVAAALRRISGISLVGDKFVYVRGLGERYSSSTLNGATIPSPDLSRNVIPLDMFPTAIVSSLAVQKAYSVDRPASFGGGAIDIRTKSIPDGFTYSLEVSSGLNSEVDDDLLSYRGGGDDSLGVDDGTRALSENIINAINRFGGSLDAQNILNALRREGNGEATLADAQVINRDLALNLNREISIKENSADPDYGFRGSIGNNFLLNDEWEFGFLVGGSYATKWRKTEALARNFTFPEERFERETESTYSVDLNGNLNLGLRYTDDHEISTTTLFLRNTDDEVAVINYFNENREKSDGIGFRDERIKYEERELVVNQIKGTHLLGEATREILPWLDVQWVPNTLQYDWYYSQSRAFTEIPNEVNVSLETVTDQVTGDVFSSNVITDSAAADYRFTSLEDEVINHGGKITWPIETSRSQLSLSGGWEYTEKVRSYRQSQFALGALDVADAGVLQGPLGTVFSDSNISSNANNFVFDLTGTNNQSYLAVIMTDALFGNVDWMLDERWRVSAGVRWEDYKQVALDWDIYATDLTRPQVTMDPEALRNAVFTDDQYYPAVSVTYMGEWLAEIFQLRIGWSETVVRPDLREITDASYIDARTGFLTDGDPLVRPADVTNFDVRAEWFFSSGDNLTVGLYLKDIDNPIEFFESAASDTNRSREIINAESGEVYGLEIEGLKNLAFMGDFWSQFFVQGNMTIQGSQLIAGSKADAPTNAKRELSGASEYVANFLLGFDSSNGAHSATLTYNVFGERLFTAGRRGAPDAYEQPFHSLDLTYSWYSTDSITLKLKLQNLLDETIEIEREGVVSFEEKPGTNFALSFNWSL
jgi:outer membrane receptor protein involved in Fe transport